MKSLPEIGRSEIFCASMTWLTSDFCVSTLHSALHFDLLLHGCDAECDRHRGDLSDRECKGCLIRAELIGLDGELIAARGQARNDRDSRTRRQISPLCTCVHIAQGDSCLRDDASRRVGNRDVERSQLLGRKMGAEQPGQPKKTSDCAKKNLLHFFPHLDMSIAVRRRASPQSHSVSEWVKPYLRSPDGGNTRKRLEIEAVPPV